MLTAKFTGNLGNQLFQLWTLYGLAYKHDHDVAWPIWDHYDKFKGEFPHYMVQPETVLQETSYTHQQWPITNDKDYTLDGKYGFGQTEKYWLECESEVRQAFDWKQSYKFKCFDKVPGLFQKKTICISIRRGDFVGNDTYYQLPIKYYIGALLTHFPDYKDYNILVLSDDPAYTKVHLECLGNVWFADNLAPIEQLCIASHCDNFIISNSTFSWWCAYLAHTQHNGEHNGWETRGKVIRPKHNFGDIYRKTHPETDFWPDRDNWIIFDHESYKYDLKDATFMIPVHYDHKDRRQNLDLSVCMLQRDFDTNIIVMEQGTDKFGYQAQWCKYVKFINRHFHRTKMLNDMAVMADTPLLFNWDADVFIPPMQIIEAAQALRHGIDFIYPYDGRFARVVRHVWFKELQSKLDVGIFGEAVHFGRGGKPGKEMATSSVGGAVGMRKYSFIQSGMENEYMISYAPEDCERWDRWHILGYQVHRIKGKLFHMDHYIGVNSSTRHVHYGDNHKELDKIRGMNAKQLREYVDTWPWYQVAEDKINVEVIEACIDQLRQHNINKKPT